MEATRTPHDTVVVAWASESLYRFVSAHGRLPATDGIRKTEDMAEAARLMAEAPCWDCGEPRENQPDVIRLLLLTGCRLGEIVGLRWDEVELGCEPPCLRLADSKTGPRTVWLGAEAIAVLEARPRDSAWVFPDRRDPRRHRPKDLCAWTRIRAEAGIDGCRIHDLRHTYASHALMAGVPLPVVSRLLGHSDIRMTMRYAHVCDSETQAAADRIGAALGAVLEEAPAG